MKRLVSIILVLAMLFSISCFADSLGHSAMLKALPELKNLETIISKQGDEGKAWSYSYGSIGNPNKKSDDKNTYFSYSSDEPRIDIYWEGDDNKPRISYTVNKNWEKDSDYTIRYQCEYKCTKINKYIIEWVRTMLEKETVKNVTFVYGFDYVNSRTKNSNYYKDFVRMTCRSLEDFDIFAEVFLNKCK